MKISDTNIFCTPVHLKSKLSAVFCLFLTRELCGVSGANPPALVHFFQKVWDLRSLFHKLLSVAGGDGISNESNTESTRHTPLPAETLAGKKNI